MLNYSRKLSVASMHPYRMPFPRAGNFKDTTNERGWPGSVEHLQRQECEQRVFFFMFNDTMKTRYHFHKSCRNEMVSLCSKLGGGNKAENSSF